MKNVNFIESTWNPGLEYNGRELIKMPHGSGLDYDWEYEETKDNFVFRNAWHAMNDNGMYVGSAAVTVRIPKFAVKDAIRDNCKIDAAQVKVHVNKADSKKLEKEGACLYELEDHIQQTIDCVNAPPLIEQFNDSNNFMKG